MIYTVRFPTLRLERYFDKFLQREISQHNIRVRIVSEVNELANNPRPFHKKSFTEIKPSIGIYGYNAEYRLRIGDYRVLFNVDDKKKVVWLLDIRRRNDRTYR